MLKPETEVTMSNKLTGKVAAVTVRLALVLGLMAVFAAEGAAGPPGPAALARARLDAARRAYDGYARFTYEQSGDPEKAYTWSRRWMEAQQALGGDRAARRAALQAHLDRMRNMERFLTEIARTGQGGQAD